MQNSTVERARWWSRFSSAKSSYMVVLIVLVAALALAGCNRRQQAEPTATSPPAHRHARAAYGYTGPADRYAYTGPADRHT